MSWLLPLALLPAALAIIRPNNIGRLPALGWNSWNAYHCDVNETDILSAAESFISKGLKDVGYEYVNIDDCWSVKSGRDNATSRLVPNPEKFPNGISGVADKIHAMGLKVGIYSDAGLETCGGYPASLGYEDIDAATFAEWGIDYLKYDNCNYPDMWQDICVACYSDPGTGPSESAPGGIGGYVNGTCLNTTGLCPPGYDYSQSTTAARYYRMRDALAVSNHTILFSMCEWGNQDVWTWGNQTGSSWRATGDINPTWSRVAEIINDVSFITHYGNFWGHNDAYMLEIGLGNLTETEGRTHFGMWAAMKSPLIIGTVLYNITQEHLDIYTNPYLLGFNQDSVYGASASPYKWGVNPDWTFNATNPAEYWAGESSNGTLVTMLNTLNETRMMSAKFTEIPGLKAGCKYNVINVWSGKDMGCQDTCVDMQVEAHDTAILLVQDEC